MAWPKGKPRPEGAGRKPGSPNKKTRTILDRLAASGKDPIQVMIDLLDDEDKQLRLTAAERLAPYIYVKRAQSIQISGSITHELQQKIEEIQKLSDTELDQIIEVESQKLIESGDE